MSQYFIADSPQVDYLSCTSYEPTGWEYIKGVLDKVFGGERREDAIMQYSGYRWVKGGGAFWGSGFQQGREHYFLSVPGQEAAEVYRLLRAPIAERWLAPTRIDLQVTVEADKWSQWTLFNRLRKAGKRPRWDSSNTGKLGRELTTVYVGSKKAEKMVRIYQKENSGGVVFLRFEAQYRQAKARAVCKGLEKGGDMAIGDRLQYELQKMGDDKLSILYAHALALAVPVSDKASKERVAGSREKWLLETVLPSFKKHIHDHDSTGEVLMAFIKEISSVVDNYRPGDMYNEK